jgi:hypothetical protein
VALTPASFPSVGSKENENRKGRQVNREKRWDSPINRDANKHRSPVLPDSGCFGKGPCFSGWSHSGATPVASETASMLPGPVNRRRLWRVYIGKIKATVAGRKGG